MLADALVQEKNKYKSNENKGNTYDCDLYE